MKTYFFVLAALTAVTSLSAQMAQDTSLLSEAVVTAHKYPGKTSQTGKVITVISKDQLERSGGKDLAQVLAEQAGIFIAGANSNPGKDKSIYLRGARIEHTLITIDGIPVYDPSGIGGNFDIRNLPINQIERIEILKGSQSTLYGSDALAGVINIITRKEPEKGVSGQVSASYGSFESLKTQAGISGRKGKTDYRAGWSFHDTRGINETVNQNNNMVTDRDGYRQQAFEAGFGFRPSESYRIQPYFRFSHIRGDIDQGAFTDELDYAYSQQSWQAGLRQEMKLGASNLTLIYNYNNIRRLYRDDSVKSRNGFDNWTEGAYNGSEQYIDAWLTTKAGTQVILTGGIDLRSSGSDQRYESTGMFGGFKTQYSRDSLRQKQLGIYTALNWNHPSGFNAEAGGRVNFHSEYGGYGVFNVNPSYLIANKVKVFANLSSAYRTPSLYQLFSEYGNRELQPEAAISMEGGIQYYGKKNKLSARMVVFSRQVNDVIFFFYNPATFSSRYINQDKQQDHGFEMEAGYRIGKGVSVKAFYQYVTGEIQTKTGGRDTTYNNLLRRPRSSGGITLETAVSQKLFVRSHLMFTGERQDAYFDSNSFSTVNTTLGAYALWNLYAEYGLTRNRLKFFADIRNITGTRYTEISGFNTPRMNGDLGIRVSF
ncbi:MAG: TonB-dependent receptor plug domain-containing protein [Chitinophagaceae bacterium]